MTDEEIMKGLECCFVTENCENCPMDKRRFIKCINKIGKNALNLINRQKAEIDKLKYEVELLSVPTISRLAQHFNKVDVVEVVRCKDCKFHREAHYEDEGEPPYIKHVCEFRKRTVQLDDFCSYGERKETDNGKV